MSKQYRKRLTKQQREQLYGKYGGRCAYCGKEISIKEMQADHIRSVFKAEFWNESPDKINSIENFRPACRMCNYYKGVWGTEAFKDNIKTMLWANLKKTFAYRFLLRYGLIEEKDHEITFLFEEAEENGQSER